jgi:Arrestin (or S-antigen), C-terminal domain/Arrestin (or S-antigen), N-terminal domain
MQFRFKGIAKTSMTVGKTRYSGEQQFFHYVKDFFGKRHGKQMEYEVGEYIYPFEYELPTNIPYSADGKFGEIYYAIKVVLDIPLTFDKEIRLPITVIRYEDLNTMPLLKYPKGEETSKTFCWFWMCCLESAPLVVRVRIPFTGFCPGQKIPISIDMNNQSHIDVKCTKITLKGLHKFVFEYPMSEKHVEKYRLDYKHAIGCAARKSIKIEENLRVPEMLNPTNDQQSRIFQITYVVKVSAVVDNPHSSLIVHIPITIGSFPLIFKETQADVKENLPNIFESSGNLKVAQTLYNEVIRLNDM